MVRADRPRRQLVVGPAGVSRDPSRPPRPTVSAPATAIAPDRPVDAARAGHRVRRPGGMGPRPCRPDRAPARPRSPSSASPQLFGTPSSTATTSSRTSRMRALVGRDLGHGHAPAVEPLPVQRHAAARRGSTPGRPIRPPGSWPCCPSSPPGRSPCRRLRPGPASACTSSSAGRASCRAAATFGAATFAFSGYMTAQIVHIDLDPGRGVAAVDAAGRPRVDRAAGPASQPTGTPGRRPSASRGWVALLAAGPRPLHPDRGAEAIIDSGDAGGHLLVRSAGGAGLPAAGAARRACSPRSVTLAARGWPAAWRSAPPSWSPGAAFVAQSQRTRLVLRLLHQRLAARPPAHPAGLAVPPRHQPGPARVLRRALQLPGGDQLRGHPGPHRRLRAAGPPVAPRPEARHWWVWYVVLAFGLLSALGNQTLLRPRPLPGPRDSTASGCSTATCSWSTAPWPSCWPGGATSCSTERDTGRSGEPRPVRSRWQPGRRAELIATVRPLRRQRPALPRPVGGRPLLDHLLETLVPDRRWRPGSSWPRWSPAGRSSPGRPPGSSWPRRRFSARGLRRLLAAVLAADLVLFNLFVIRPPITEAHGPGPGAGRQPPSQARGGRRPLHHLRPRPFYGDQLLGARPDRSQHLQPPAAAPRATPR